MSSIEILRQYRRILSVALAIKDNSSKALNGKGESFEPIYKACLPPFPPSLVLPGVPSILQSLVDCGIRNDIAQRISSSFDRAMVLLREETQSSFQKAWSQLIAIPRHSSLLSLEDLYSQLCKTHIALYQRRAEKWASEVRRCAVDQQSHFQEKFATCSASESSVPLNRVRPSFNNDYLPVLEAFFLEEQFPSREDKVFLAKKSGMTYRQIHIWFQNRRSRSKKYTAANTDPLAKSESVSQNSEETDVDDTPNETSSSRSSSFTLVVDADPFSWTTPPHAFPSKYPPDFDTVLDPFHHCRFGDFTSFPKAIWSRTPTPYAMEKNTCDVPKLIEAFEKLSLGSKITFAEPVRVWRTWGSFTPRRPTGCNVTNPYITRTHPAPLASLIRFPSLHKTLRPCPIFHPGSNYLMDKAGEDPPNPSRVSKLEANVSSWESSRLSDVVLSIPSALAEKRGRSNGNKKISGPPRRTPANRPISEVQLKMHMQSDPVISIDSSAAALVKEQHTCISTQHNRSTSTDLGKLSPSLSSRTSSRSGSERHSPVTPILDLSDISPVFSASPSGGTNFLSTSLAPSNSLLEGVSKSLFPSSDFIFDHSLLNLPMDDSYDLAFAQFDKNNIFSPTSCELAIPSSLPFSIDYSTLVS